MEEEEEEEQDLETKERIEKRWRRRRRWSEEEENGGAHVISVGLLLDGWGDDGRVGDARLMHAVGVMGHHVGGEPAGHQAVGGAEEPQATSQCLVRLPRPRAACEGITLVSEPTV